MKNIILNLPIDKGQISSLKCGDIVSLFGTIYTARDAAHKLIFESIKRGEKPFVPNPIYYCGPTPAKDGEAIGSCGPTTSSRMDDYTPLLIEHGLNIMIGKGKRSQEVLDAMKKHTAVYLVAVGGAGALMKNYVTDCKVIEYPHLGCEAIHMLTVKGMELVVAADSNGNTILN